MNSIIYLKKKWNNKVVFTKKKTNMCVQKFYNKNKNIQMKS